MPKLVDLSVAPSVKVQKHPIYKHVDGEVYMQAKPGYHWYSLTSGNALHYSIQGCTTLCSGDKFTIEV